MKIWHRVTDGSAIYLGGKVGLVTECLRNKKSMQLPAVSVQKNK